MGFWIFLGVFLAVAVGSAAIYFILREKIRRFSRDVFGTSDLLAGLKAVDSVADESPRSLNGCDTLLLPQILADFPDFDVSMTKTHARSALQKKYGNLNRFTIYNVVISRYLRAATQKTIVLQAAASYQNGGEKKQKRYDLYYVYVASGSSETVAANCPNCGAALGYGEVNCPYCGSQVGTLQKNTWEFTEIRES